MQMKFLAMIATMVTAVGIQAKPVVWYHFNEQSVGTRASGVQSIVNAANPGQMNASPKVLDSGKTGFIDDANWTPKYDHAFSPLVTWRDGESTTHGEDNVGFRLVSSDGNGYGSASVVVLDDDERLHLKKFTTELFVRVEPGVTLMYQALLCQLRNGNDHLTSAWQIRLNVNGSVTIYATTEDGQTGVVNKNLTNVRRSLADGFWHHVALTCDGADLKVYADYKLLATYNLAANGLTDGIVYAENTEGHTLTIGGSDGTTWGRFQGWIDEYRLSDEALDPKDFLRTIPVSGDTDTLVYIPCDTTPVGTVNANALIGPDKLEALPVIMYSGVLPAANADRPGDGATIRDGLLTAANVTNSAAYLFEANDSAGSTTTGRTARIEINDLVNGTHTFLTNKELTVEMFIKPAAMVDYNNVTKYIWGVHTGRGVQQMNVRTNGKLTCGLQYDDGGQESHISTAVVRDGKWHHVALVFDGNKKESYLYIDRALEHTWTNMVADATEHTGSYFKNFNFCAAYNGTQATAFRGLVDEIRVTKRALAPREFLTTRPVSAIPDVASKKVLFYAPLDGNAKAYPFEDSPAGALNNTSYAQTDLPLEEIAARTAMGLETANAASVKVGSASKSGIAFDDAMALEGAETLTVEFYAKAPQTSQWAPFVRLEGEKGVYFQICKGADGTGNLAVMLGNNLTYGSYIQFANAKLDDDKWHHYAVTIEKKETSDKVVTEVKAYRDRWELRKAADSKVNPTVSGSMGFASRKCKMYLGRAATWAALNGCLDEVRVVEGVLAPENFMDPLAFPDVAGHKVLFYAPLDGDANAYPIEAAGTLDSGITYTATDRPLEEIAGRTVMGLTATNAAAAAFPGAASGAKGITYGDATTLVGRESLTIEFYAKAPEASQWIPFVRHEGSSLYFQICKGSNGTGNLALMFKTDKNDGTGSGYIQFDGAKLNGNRWHHYAVTLEKKTNDKDETVTEVHAYIDHEEMSVWDQSGYKSTIVPGALLPAADDSAACIYLGRAKTWAALKGCVDEVRIVEGVLEPEEFMDACPKKGFVILVR